MSDKTAILAIDQGTTSSRAIGFDTNGQVLAVAQEEFAQIYPHPGWVEHDPEVIWATVLSAVRKVLARLADQGYQPACIGITNQRETTIVWDRKTGRPIHNAIVWQDRRTASLTRELDRKGLGQEVQKRAGLVLDPYFSATKIGWILDQVSGARAKAEAGDLAFGTIESFLIWRLTGGKVHVTDATNASRTSLYNLVEQDWDLPLLEIFNIPRALLPEVVDCAGSYGETAAGVLDIQLPITGAAGDQQAAAIGQACLKPGEMKSTYGTGAFMILNTGAEPVLSQNRLLTTTAWRLNGQSAFALEGSVLSAGATVQWLRDGLGIISKSSEVEGLAAEANPEAQVYLVPAFAGLGAPHWDADARGLICGLTRGSGRAEIARAALDSTVYQTHDLLQAMARDGAEPVQLRVDGGMVKNDIFLQRLSDLCDVRVVRPRNAETTSWGAGFLAGLGAGLYTSLEEVRTLWQADREFEPDMDDKTRSTQLSGWQAAVSRTLSQPSA